MLDDVAKAWQEKSLILAAAIGVAITTFAQLAKGTMEICAVAYS